jgi:Ca-activated chloride channel family protein
VTDAASEGIGLTVFGVGIGLGPEVFKAMSEARGGNAFTLYGSRDIERIMTNDWPYLASPLAYDLRVALEPSDALDVAEGYGFPTTDKEAKLETNTVFLSKRRGALLVRLEPKTDLSTLAVNGTLSYETLDGERVQDDLSTTFEPEPDARGQAFAQPSVGKTVTLAILVSGMNRAAQDYAEDKQRGAERMQRVATRFKNDAEALGDDALTGEVTLAEDLLELMK